jgi:hypothetical protein
MTGEGGATAGELQSRLHQLVAQDGEA